MIKGIRGAITVNSNSQEAICDAVCELLNQIMAKNSLKKEEIAYCIFSMTDDLTAAYPARFAREQLNFNDVSMMCVQELKIENSLKMCLRVLVVTNSNNPPKHVYLKGASTLREDLK